MSEVVREIVPLGFVWSTLDPFLFCVHHDDRYPAGNGRLGPAASLAGRQIGQDFEGKDGWRMYHGDVVPGFPQHPHRGFETVTLVRRGLIDHSDSLGATARFGRGDTQWLTAGAGIVHSEMFPLLNTGGPNPAELFQIWLNLPSVDKHAPPHFSMLWADSIPTVRVVETAGKTVDVTLVAGALDSTTPPAPPPRSWAARPDTDVAIWTLRFDAGASWTLPPAKQGSNRMLYLFSDGPVRIGGRQVSGKCGVRLTPDVPAQIEAEGAAELVLLQGRPIGEPVAQHGPFVMNNQAEIQQAFADYRRTGFGGWPWRENGPTHGLEDRRFARHADGRVERREG
ncbi:hypothetical protein LBMAG42_29530 [Deltaproteobacteria bacterium]|nr:hypothetical protein LBMAG42_29530 [Deltaproteobacteria bacterium]